MVAGRQIQIPPQSQLQRVPVEPPTPHQNLFGITANTLRVRTLPLDTASENKEINGIVGNFLWILNATSLTASADIKFEHDQGQDFTIKKGFFLSGVEFNKFVLSNTAQSGQSLTIMYGIAANPPLNVVNPSSDASSVSVTKSADLASVADVTVTANASVELLAADSLRREAIIKNPATNANTHRIGDSAVTATRGVALAPGEAIVISSTDAIHSHNDGAGDEDLTIMTVND